MNVDSCWTCDPARFQRACTRLRDENCRDSGIGTLGEKSIHAILKYYFDENPDTHELPIGSSVADILGENGVIEIQSRMFHRLNAKLNALLPECPVTVVYPVIRRKRIHWCDPQTGEILKSGAMRAFRKDDAVFAELYQIREHVLHPNFRLCIAAMEADDYRLQDGFGADRRFRATKVDRYPTRLLEIRLFSSPADYAVFVPADFPDSFDSARYARLRKIPVPLAQVSLRMLARMNVIAVCGHDGRKNLYCRSGQPGTKNERSL